MLEVELSYVQEDFTGLVGEFSDKYLLRLWTRKDTESFQRKSHPRFTIRLTPSCFPNSITGEKRPRSCSRGSILFLYSDGVFDGSGQKEPQQLEIVMREHNLQPAKDMRDALLEYALERDDRLRQIGEEDRIDDKTVFIIKRN